MIVHGNRKYISSPFDSEEELERVVVEHSELIFGPDSVFLPKRLIRSAEGAGTVPDGFVLDLRARRWFIVEAELASHSVWSHIAPQIAKQTIAASQPASRQRIVDLLVESVKEDPQLLERFEEYGIAEIDIRREASRLLEDPPIIGLPIDHVNRDLREWAETLRLEVRLWVVRKLVDFEDPSSVIYEIPDEFRPALDTTSEDLSSGRSVYDVSISDLLSGGYLQKGQELKLSYQPRGRERRVYCGIVDADGSIDILGKRFSAPSYAALHAIQDAGSPRQSVNGWVVWKDGEGRSLAELRDQYLASNLTQSPGS